MQNEDDFVNDASDKNNIYLAIQIIYTRNLREIAAAIVNMNERKFQVTEFLDNEHFSNLESLILQTNPNNNYADFTVLILYPQLNSEKEKIKDILGVSDVKVIEKQKKDFPEKGFENDLDKLLKVPLMQLLQETQSLKALSSLSCINSHLTLTNESNNFKQYRLESFVLNNFMKLDLAAMNALCIFPKNYENKAANETEYGTLIDLLDQCKTQIGSRCLRRWVKQPLQNIEQINRRLTIVDSLVREERLRSFLQNDFLKKIPDLDKLYSKFYKVSSNRRHNGSLVDCIKVYQLVINIKSLVDSIPAYLNKDTTEIEGTYLTPFNECLQDFEKLEEMVEKAIDLNKAKEGEYLINPNFSNKLLGLNNEITKVAKNIDRIKKEVEDDLGVNVKLVESTTHTYLFEVNKKDGDQAFRRTTKKYKTTTIKNKIISFTNDKLSEQCAHHSDFLQQYKEEQAALVTKILGVVATYHPAMEKASSIISELDVLVTFAHVSASAPVPYVRPTMNIGGNLVILENRHPCLEMQDRNSCVANDCEMNREKSKLHIITGPNMGGKSTYIRQVAITVLMAHVGCFVPAKSAEVPLIDAIITRVGASDIQLRGISTFMSEMLEASCMLKIGSENSLVIIDELGRGTSTSEGFGLAWGIAEHMVKVMKCYCLFATHFHEMTMMEGQIEGVKNFYVSAIIKQGQLTMLYKVKPGAVDRSYGLFVAEMLKFPDKIIRDANKKAKELENYENFVSGIHDLDDDDMEIEEMESEINQEIYLNENLSLGDKIKLLSKGSSSFQKIKIVRMVEDFQNLSKDKSDYEKEEMITNLIENIYKELSSKQVNN